MSKESENTSLQEEYDKFKILCPNAKEKVYEDGSRVLYVEQDGIILFRLYYLKKGKSSEKDVFVVKNWKSNPRNVEQIVSAYNAFMPDKIGLSKIADQQKNYYIVTDKGNDDTEVTYTTGFIRNLKRLNPDVEISGKWIVRNNTREQFTIITSKPIEQLNQPTGDYGDALGRIIFPETYEEFTQSMHGDFLNYGVSEQDSLDFVDVLREFNPNARITMTYDETEKVGKISSSIPLDKLKYPAGNRGGIGLDKDGNIACIHDKIINFVIADEHDDRFPYMTAIQKYYDSVSRKKEQEKTTQEQEKTTKRYYNEFGQLIQSNSQDELTRMAREKRKFNILQRERAMSDAQKAKNRSAIMAGICILGAVGAVYFNGQDVHQVLQHELNAIYSWEALGQYLQDLGPLTTLLSASACGFIAKYFKNSRRQKQAQNEIIDFFDSLEFEQTLGDDENAKSRRNLNSK